MKATTVTVLVAAVAIAIPAQANAGRFGGVVLAKQTQRGALVLATRNGAGLTVRSSARVRLGDRVEVRARRLHDGTVRASRLSVRSHARQAVIRGVVVRRFARSTLVSTGGSVLSIRRPANHGDLRAGTVVEFRVRIVDDLVEETAARPLAQVANVEIEGEVVSVSPLVISLEGLPITITVPAGMTLPAALDVGDRVELVVQVGAANTFTLVAIEEIENENENVEQEVEVKGSVVSSTSTQLVVQSHGTTFTFAAPAGVTLPILPVGTFVEVRAVSVHGVLTVERLKIEDEDDDGGGH